MLEDADETGGVVEDKKGKKRTRACVPRWPQLPEISEGSSDKVNKGPCDVWPDEKLTWPEHIPVTLTMPCGSWETLQSLYVVPPPVADAGNKNLVYIHPTFWSDHVDKLPVCRDHTQPFVVTKVGHKYTLRATWSLTMDAPHNFYFCSSDALKFEFEWDAQWTDVARARQHRWGTHPHVAVPAFMKHLEGLSGRYSTLTAAQMRLMGYPLLRENVIAHGSAVGSLSGRWFCQPRSFNGVNMHIGDGFLVHPRPADILVHALSLPPMSSKSSPMTTTPVTLVTTTTTAAERSRLNQSEPETKYNGLRSTLVIHDSDKLLTPDAPNVFHVDTVSDLFKINRKSLKRGGLTLIVRHGVINMLPRHVMNEFSKYNARKKARVPTVFTDIEWGRVIVVMQQGVVYSLPTIKCLFWWTLCTPDVCLHVSTGLSSPLSWMELRGEWRSNRHRMLQFVDTQQAQ